MFKVGQVWQGTRNKGHIILIKRVHETMSLVGVEFIEGPRKGHKGWIYAGTVEVECVLIGNNYQERPTTKAEKPAMTQSHTLKLVLRGGSLRPDGRFWYSETTIKQIAAEAGIEVQS